MRFGVHVSIARGPAGTLSRALERGCEAIQIFSSNPRGWALSPSAPAQDLELRSLLDDHGIDPVLVHTPYLVNIAASDRDVLTRSAGSLVHAAQRAERLRGYVVVHAGRDQENPRDAVLERAAATLLAAAKLVPNARILVEPTAGGRGAVASRIEEVAELLQAAGDHERLGACLDTCHAFAAGDDLSDPGEARAWVDRSLDLLGDRLVALHVNDSRDPCGSNRDRHWHLGRGEIGEAGFRALLAHPGLGDRGAILETPGKSDDDRRNLARARRFAKGQGR